MLDEEWGIFHFLQVAIVKTSLQFHKIIVFVCSHKKGDLRVMVLCLCEWIGLLYLLSLEYKCSGLYEAKVTWDITL